MAEWEVIRSCSSAFITYGFSVLDSDIIGVAKGGYS